jgi:hypothetical protein
MEAQIFTRFAPSDRQADLVDISCATDIHDTQFDDPTHPIAVSGVLDPSITPANYIPFVNYLNATQLAKFGLHNGAVCPLFSVINLHNIYLSQVTQMMKPSLPENGNPWL